MFIQVRFEGFQILSTNKMSEGSGDIIQFGVEVVENTTTRGCIIAQVSIFMSAGSEIRWHSDMAGLTSSIIPISNYAKEHILIGSIYPGSCS